MSDQRYKIERDGGDTEYWRCKDNGLWRGERWKYDGTERFWEHDDVEPDDVPDEALRQHFEELVEQRGEMVDRLEELIDEAETMKREIEELSARIETIGTSITDG